MPEDLLDRARSAVHDRAELPGMSLMQHLEELRNRILWSLGYPRFWASPSRGYFPQPRWCSSSRSPCSTWACR